MRYERPAPPCGLPWLCLLALEPWLAASAAAPPGALDEASVLLQGQLRSHAGTRPKYPRVGYERNLAHHLLGAVDNYLTEYEKTRLANVEQASEMQKVVDKYLSDAKSYFQERRDGVFRQQDLPVSDLMSGMIGLIDGDLAKGVLELMRNPEFVRGLDVGITNISKTATAFSLRMEKKIMELKMVPKESAPSEIPALTNQFIERQEHIAKTTLKSQLALLRDIFESMPKEYQRLAGVSERMLERLGNRATLELSNLHRRLLSSTGADACSAYTRFTQDTKQMYPLIIQALNMLPMLENVARVKVPEVAPDAKQLALKMQKAGKTLRARLDKDLNFLLDTICSLAPKVEEPVQLVSREASFGASSEEARVDRSRHRLRRA